MKKEADDKKMQHERTERRIVSDRRVNPQTPSTPHTPISTPFLLSLKI